MRNFLVEIFQKMPKNTIFGLFFKILLAAQKFWSKQDLYRNLGELRKINLVDLKKSRSFFFLKIHPLEKFLDPRLTEPFRFIDLNLDKTSWNAGFLTKMRFFKRKTQNIKQTQNIKKPKKNLKFSHFWVYSILYSIWFSLYCHKSVLLVQICHTFFTLTSKSSHAVQVTSVNRSGRLQARICTDVLCILLAFNILYVIIYFFIIMKKIELSNLVMELYSNLYK